MLHTWYRFERSPQILSLMVCVKEESSSVTVKCCWSFPKMGRIWPKVGLLSAEMQMVEV